MTDNTQRTSKKGSFQPMSEHTQTLSVQLKQRTAEVHDHAESSAFVSNLMAGNLEPEAFADLVSQLWFIYSALEAAVRAAHEADPTGPISAVYDPLLERQRKVEADLTELFGTNWEDKIRITEATQDYVARLNELRGAEAAPAVVAHHYVRYLGDIAGGQVIARRASELYNVPDEALNFYDFTEIGKIKPYRDRYKAAVDGLDLTDSQREELLNEAVVAFRHNFEVFGALARRHAPVAA